MSSQDPDNSSATTAATGGLPITTEKATSKPPITESTSPDDYTHAAKTWTKAFEDDPVLRWMLHHRKKRNLMHNEAFRLFSFTLIARTHRANKGRLFNVDGNWQCVGLCFNPGSPAENVLQMFLEIKPKEMWKLLTTLGVERSWRNIITYSEKTGYLKKQYLTKQRIKDSQYFYIAMLGTLKEARGQGLASAWMRGVQHEARGAKAPIWLETSTEGAKKMYEKIGFRNIDCIHLGEGKVSIDGWSVKKGHEDEGKEAVGACLWSMVWWPEGVAEDSIK